MSSSDLPVFDFSPFHGGTRARAERAAGIGRASTEIGFFYFKNFGIEPTRISEVFAQSQSFFALPRRRKHELLLDRTNRGYDGLEAQSFQPGRPGDLKEPLPPGSRRSPELSCQSAQQVAFRKARVSASHAVLPG
jgi:isopenicillin N synthase-like dioxygenase